jgi:hypothetical protein
MATRTTRRKPALDRRAELKRRLPAAFADMLSTFDGRWLFKVSAGPVLLKSRPRDSRSAAETLRWLNDNANYVVGEVQITVRVREDCANLGELLNQKP